MFSELFIRAIKIDKSVAEKGEYIFDLPVVKNLKRIDELKFEKKVTFFVGENGTGKSTLLEAIAVAYGFNAEGGTKNFNFSTRKTHSGLCDYLKIIKGVKQAKDGFFLRAESFYNVASQVEDLDDGAYSTSLLASYGGISLHEQSHGESFMSLVLNRFWGNGIYILDEPESALSPSRQLSLMVAIKDLVDKGSQFIIATHSPILLTFPDSKVLVLEEDGINQTHYKDTDHFMITKRFLHDPEGMLEMLFNK